MVWVGRQGAEETATWALAGVGRPKGLTWGGRALDEDHQRVVLQPEAALMLSNSPLIFDNVYWR
jgi:hypothetical protein